MVIRSEQWVSLEEGMEQESAMRKSSGMLEMF